MRWELRRLLPSLGYVWKSSTTKVSDTVRDQRPHWLAWWFSAGLDVATSFGQSAKSIASTPGSNMHDLVEAEQEFWVSTPAMLTCLSHWPHHRRQVDDRKGCRTVFLMALERMIPTDVILQGGLPKLGAAARAACHVEPVLAGTCACVQAWEADAQASMCGSHARAAELLCSLAQMSHCQACQQHLGWCCSYLAAAADARYLVWGEPISLADDAAWMPGLSGKKRRRSDPHARGEACASTASSSVGPAAVAIGANKATSSQVSRWRGQHLCTLQASSHLAFQTPCVLSSALDATRLGQPAVEMLLHMVVRLPTGGTTVLPPAATSLATVGTDRFWFCDRQLETPYRQNRQIGVCFFLFLGIAVKTVIWEPSGCIAFGFASVRTVRTVISASPT